MTSTIAYADHADGRGDLHVPATRPPADGWPVVVLVHGGFWREAYRRDLMTPLADDLGSRGIAAWNLEYRRVRGAGGWPDTVADVAAGIDHLAVLADDHPLDLGRVAFVGHSAGGHLVLWAAARHRLGAAPGGPPQVRPVAVVAQAPVADLLAADVARLSGGAVRELLGGGPATVPARYALADPIRHVDHGHPVLLVHAPDDEVVPFAQSTAYAAAVRAAGGSVDVVATGGSHLEVIDPAGEPWAAVDRWLRPRLLRR